MKKLLLILVTFWLMHQGKCQQWFSMDSVLRFPNDPGFITQLVRVQDTLYVSGGFTIVDNIPYPPSQLYGAIASYGNHSWSLMGNGLRTGLFNDVEYYNNKLMVAGNFWWANGVPNTKYIAAWNNGNWESISDTTTSNVISDMAVFQDTLFVVGGFGQIGDQWSVGIGAFDGTYWHLFPSGADNQVGACEVYKGKLYIGGWFGYIGGALANGLASYNGHTFEEVGGGILGYVNSLYVDPAKNQLYVGGYYGMAGDTVANSIAMWDGHHFHSLGEGINGNLLPDGIVQYHGEIYVAGVFTEAGGKPIKHIARWNGQDWDSLGLGVNNTVHALEVYQDTLWVGGNFDTVGGMPSYGLAKWYTPPPEIPEASGLEELMLPLPNTLKDPVWSKGLEVFPNPTNGEVYIKAPQLEGKQVTVLLTNALGKVFYIKSHLVTASTINLQLPLAKGTYTLTVMYSNQQVSRQVVKQ